MLSLLSIVGLIFLVGFGVGNRSFFANQPSIFNIVSKNGSNLNIYSGSNFANMEGRSSVNQVQSFGEVIYKLNGDQYDILVRLTNVPTKLDAGAGLIDLPSKFKVNLAMRSSDGLDYIYQGIGILTTVVENNSLNGVFTTSISKSNLNIFSVERVVLFNEVGGSNLPAFENEIFPSAVRSRPAPYFWSGNL